jgi:C-terminal processing protease CtpA/Prc
MSIRQVAFFVCAIAMLAGSAVAQESEQENADRARHTEAESEREVARRVVETREVEVRMREAERRLAEAARQVADLSMSQLPRVERLERVIRAGRGPVLGVTIGAEDDGDPVEGVEVLGVSPGGAAEEAGIRAGDIITAINGDSFTADSGEEANDKLLDFMLGIEEGDELDVEYLRNGKSESVTVAPRPLSNTFAFSFDGRDFSMPDVHVAPGIKQFEKFLWMSHDDGFGDMELVALTERLGSYFGTSEGLLVVRAPEKDDMKLEDGDVILNIDGRKPSSVSHAMRILGSYQAGEELKIEIMRDKRKRTIEIEIPDNRQSRSAAPVVPEVHVIPQRAVIIEQDRT